MSFTSFAIVEGLGERVPRGDGTEGALVENALEGLIAAVGELSLILGDEVDQAAW